MLVFYYFYKYNCFHKITIMNRHEGLRNPTLCIFCQNDLIDPRMLPCGHTLCHRHYNNINTINCPQCPQLQPFRVPPNGFPPNAIMVGLLENGFVRMPAGELYNRAIQALNNLTHAITRYNRTKDNVGINYLDEIDDSIDRVENKYKELIEEVTRLGEESLLELRNYKNICEPRYAALRREVNQTVNRATADLAGWTAEMQMLDIGAQDPRYTEIERAADERLNEMHAEITEFERRQNLVNNQDLNQMILQYMNFEIRGP